MSTPTKVDAQGRDRAVGPVEASYDRWVRRTSWMLGLALFLSVLAWLMAVTNVEPLPGAWFVSGLALTTALALLPARIVVGALRDAAEAAGR